MAFFSARILDMCSPTDTTMDNARLCTNRLHAVVVVVVVEAGGQ